MKLPSRGPGFYFFLPLFLVFFALPYLFDIVFCEDLYTTQLSQAALIDAEKVDPYSIELSPTLDDTTTGASNIYPPATIVAFVAPVEYAIPRRAFPVSLVSRPPPTF